MPRTRCRCLGFEDVAALRSALDALASKLDGKQAAAKTVRAIDKRVVINVR